MQYTIFETTKVTFAKLEDGSLRCTMMHERPPFEGFTLSAGSYDTIDMWDNYLDIYDKDSTLKACFKCATSDILLKLHKDLLDVLPPQQEEKQEERELTEQEQLDLCAQKWDELLAKEAEENEDDGIGACGYKCDGRCRECGSGGFDMADEI